MPGIGIGVGAIGIGVNVAGAGGTPGVAADRREYMLASPYGMIFVNEEDGTAVREYCLPGLYLNEAA